MYKKASKLGLRFSSTRGNVTVEDLWDLPLEELDAIAQQCYAECEHKVLSFIKDVVPANEKNELRFEIVKDVIADRLAARLAAETAQANAQKKSRMLELLAKKQDESLSEKSEDELLAMINAL